MSLISLMIWACKPENDTPKVSKENHQVAARNNWHEILKSNQSNFEPKWIQFAEP